VIKFYKSPIPAAMQIYNGETKGKDWDDVSYASGLPTDWAANNTEERIRTIIKAPASRFAFNDKIQQTSYVTAVGDSADDTLIVLKGIHQYKSPAIGAAFAHITIAWGTYLCHFDVHQLGIGSGVTGVAALGVHGVTEGAKAVSSEATGWTAVRKKGK
jgi:hypothetical protein